MNSMIIIDIAVPVFNEEKYLVNCLDSILKFVRPENVEYVIYIVDGMSTDNTKSIALSYSERFENVKYFSNPQKIQSCALNLVVKKGKGNFILRLDAHAKYPENYLLNCFQAAMQTGADNVGGIVVTLKGENTFEASLVQAMTTHKFGVGNSAFRTEGKVGEADTVPFGFFKKEIFEKIGLYDERLVRCQDYEFNRRIVKNGGRIWMDSKIYSEYYNQPTLIKFYGKQFFKEAPYNPYMWNLAPYAFAVRHAITGVFTSGIVLGAFLSILFPIIESIYISVLGLYFILAILSGIQQAIRFKKFLFIFILPFCFFLYHFIHGTGIMVGIFKILTKTAPIQQSKMPWEGYEKLYRENNEKLSLPKI